MTYLRLFTIKAAMMTANIKAETKIEIDESPGIEKLYLSPAATTTINAKSVLCHARATRSG